MMSGLDIVRQLSQGLVNPFPSFKWCCFSLASSDTAPVVADVETVAAYSTADVPEPDILALWEKERCWEARGPLRELRRLRMNTRIGCPDGGEGARGCFMAFTAALPTFYVLGGRRLFGTIGWKGFKIWSCPDSALHS